MSPRLLLQSPPRVVCISNAFIFSQFRTLCIQRRFATPLPSTTSALFSLRRRVGVPSSKCPVHKSSLLPWFRLPRGARGASTAGVCGDSSSCSSPSTAICQLSTSSSPYESPVTHHRSQACFAHFALCYHVCFQANTTVNFCNSFILITMQIARGVGGSSHFPFSTFPVSHPSPRRLHPSRVSFVFMYLRMCQFASSLFSNLYNSGVGVWRCDPGGRYLFSFLPSTFCLLPFLSKSCFTVPTASPEAGLRTCSWPETTIASSPYRARGPRDAC